MALQKQPISLNFMKGLETKTDPYQIPIGNFASLKNTVFSTTGRLTKRTGYPLLTTVTSPSTNITTLNGNLVATGTNLLTYSQDTDQWIDQGKIQPVQLSTLSLLRNNSSQYGADIGVNSNGLSCLAYSDDDGNSYYHIVDSTNGSQVVERTQLPATSGNTRVFVLGGYFIITFIADVLGTNTLQYIAIPLANPTNPSVATTISTDVKSIDAGYDGYVMSNRLFLAWGNSTADVSLRILNRNLSLSTATVLNGSSADLMSVTASTNRVFIAFWDSGTMDGYSAAFDFALTQVMDLTQIITATEINEITSVASSTVQTVFYETVNTYSYSLVRTDFVSSLTVTLPSTVTTGTVSPSTVILRSVGLASKAFIAEDGTIYVMVEYGDVETPSDSNQPTYFLIDQDGNIYLKIAYANGGGYQQNQILPQITLLDQTYYFPYMINDFLATVNKGTDLPSGTPTNAIYTSTGINLATFTLNTSVQHSSEIAGALHLTGGQLWEFDTIKPVEHGFHVWPEDIYATAVNSGGNITNQTYNYVFTYEWTDNAGQLHRSAPSIPLTVEMTGANDTVILDVPTLRVTAKDDTNPVRIVGYRWSTAQQTYYQFTSLTNPTLNDTTVDSVQITDTLADSAILGNTLLYTTGGVLENIGAPASVDSCLFDNRMVLIDANDPNLLWFSKQVIQNVPVEFSDLLTIYVSPTTGAQQSTGPSRCLSAMDDKLIIFKDNAIYYVNGNGPDNTGANSGYSNPVYITGIAGSNNPNSIVLIPQGIMFQSNKGIWLLGRDLSTKYIGASVEAYNSFTVLSSEVIPNTTQVRFILDNSETLVYDYFYDQWAVHTNVSAISAVIYQNAHTYLNEFNQVLQETSGVYKDNNTPVLISFTTGWINLAGIQGFERFYFGYLLGTYHTPFKLNFKIAYDYNSSAQQATIITPNGNEAQRYGDEALWGSGPPWGGSEGNVFTSRIFPKIQKCTAFQITVEEVYDPAFGISAGEGLSLSGLNLVIGTKRGFRTQKASQSFG